MALMCGIAQTTDLQPAQTPTEAFCEHRPRRVNHQLLQRPTKDITMPRYIKRIMLIIAVSLSALSSQVSLAQGQPTAASTPDLDNRRSIVVIPKERVRILYNMRQYLIGLQQLTEAVANDQMDSAIAAARSMGSIRLYDLRLKFANEAVIEFHTNAFEVHQDFDRIAAAAEQQRDGTRMLRDVAALMKKCTHCHETFRLQDTAH